MKKDKTVQEMAKEHAQKLIEEMGEFNAFIESWSKLISGHITTLIQYLEYFGLRLKIKFY